ncbi:MAG: efflux RND transporter permease subunit, partial [Candidatus Latescibacteria bacterium]|nr:efflux RND transporter permease subunit [Candidatus Latescibacterota bacterium]
RAGTPFLTSQGEMDIRFLTLGAEERQPEDIGALRLQSVNGPPVLLRDVADVRLDEGEGNIVRFNQERQVQIRYDFTEQVRQSQTSLDRAEAQIAQLVATFRLPEGFILEPIEPEDEQTVYYWMFGIGVLLIYMFLASQFESLLSPLVILGTVPTAIIGASWALMLSGTALSLGEGAPMALLGLIVLLGIVVNNGIILIDRIAVLRRRQDYRWQRAVLTASQRRVRPIVMTSVTTMLGVLPLALKQGTELELWPPFAITILGGLAVSTFSTLIFIPVLYVGLEQTRAWCRQIGTAGLVAGTAAAILELVWLYQQYPSKLYVGLLALPAWFLNLGFAYGIKRYRTISQEKVRPTDHILGIRISNLTKVYGTPGRFRRDWRKQRRRTAAAVRKGGIPWTAHDVMNGAIWLGTGGLLMAYLHTVADHSFWVVLLTLLTLGWLFGVRELWYAFRFVKGRPPARTTGRWWRRRVPFKSFRLSPSEHDRPVTPLDMPRRGGLWFALLCVGYLHLRLNIPGLTIAAGLISLFCYQLHRIGRHIEQGRINPEQPAGRLRKLKRVVYSLVRSLPVIRPPDLEVTALRGVNLDIGPGMFGLLGPNGAGKTTLMRILVGVLNQDRGSIFINGRKLDDEREVFHAAIGYLPQGFGLYETMTPYAYLENHALINGIYEPAVRQRLIEDVLHGVGLWDRRHDRINTFSGGMKQRVGIAQTLLHLPQIIVVDEPTVGLDPRERIRFRNLLGELAKDRIVVFSTHIVEDVASTCHDLAVLFGGEVLYRGSPETLIRRAEEKVYETVVPEDRLDEWRQRLHIVNHNKVEGGVRLRFVTDSPETGLAPDLDARPVTPTLEDAYVNLLRGTQMQDTER